MDNPLRFLSVEIMLRIFHQLHTVADALALAGTCSELRSLFHQGRNKEQILESVVGLPEDLDSRYDLKESFSAADGNSGFQVLAQISDSTWWIQGKQGCNYILCAADYEKFTRKSISKYVLRDTRFICNSPRQPEFADALHIFLSQLSDLEMRTPNPWEEGSVKILQSAAKYQQGILAASETIPIDFSRDDTLVALSLNCLCRTVSLEFAAKKFPEYRDLEEPARTIQHARHGRGNKEDALLPRIEYSKDTTGWTPPTRSWDRGWNLDSSMGLALHHILRRTRRLIFQGNPKDWPTVLYVLCIVDLFVETIHPRRVWMRSLKGAESQLQLLIESLCHFYYLSTGGGQPFSYDWDREMYARQVAGNQLAVEHFAELNSLWEAWFACQSMEFHDDFAGLLGFRSIIRAFSRDVKKPVFAL